MTVGVAVGVGVGVMVGVGVGVGVSVGVGVAVGVGVNVGVAVGAGMGVGVGVGIGEGVGVGVGTGVDVGVAVGVGVGTGVDVGVAVGAAVGIGVGVGGVVGVFAAPAPLQAAASKRASNVSPPKTRGFMETRRRIADVNRSEPRGAGAPVSRAGYGRIACAPLPRRAPAQPENGARRRILSQCHRPVSAQWPGASSPTRRGAESCENPRAQASAATWSAPTGRMSRSSTPSTTGS